VVEVGAPAQQQLLTEIQVVQVAAAHSQAPPPAAKMVLAAQEHLDKATLAEHLLAREVIQVVPAAVALVESAVIVLTLPAVMAEHMQQAQLRVQRLIMLAAAEVVNISMTALDSLMVPAPAAMARRTILVPALLVMELQIRAAAEAAAQAPAAMAAMAAVALLFVVFLLSILCMLLE
jgi:hypothetical protein